MIASIQPVSVWPSTATQILFELFRVTPNVTLLAQYRLLDSGGAQLTVNEVSMTADQYSGWSGTVDDDVYIPSCLCANLGLTVVSGQM